MFSLHDNCSKVLGFTQEQSRISLIAATSALVGSLFGAALGLWGTYAKFAEGKNVQIRADPNRAYTQLEGQQAELFVLSQQMALAFDKGNFCQMRAAQQTLEARKSQKASNYQESYTSDALQQERNAEHYADEVVVCSEKMFESIGLIQLSFSSDAELNEKIANVESMLTSTEDMFPMETLQQRALWAMTEQDTEKEINSRAKRRVPYIQKAMEPITDLLNYLQYRISK